MTRNGPRSYSLPTPFPSPLSLRPSRRRSRDRVLSCLSNFQTCGRGVNMSSSEEFIDIEWWTEESLDLSLDVSGGLYADMVSKVQC